MPNTHPSPQPNHLPTLAIDIGGTNVKILLQGAAESRKVPSGPTMTPSAMVAAVKELAGDWGYGRVSIGYPGVVRRGAPVAEPHNLGAGWVGFDYAAAFGVPVRMVNDAAMQALGDYREGTLLFLGLGTGLGSALVVEGALCALELAHLPYRKGRSYEEELGSNGLKRLGRKRWQRRVEEVVALMQAAFVVDQVVIGGGNAKKLDRVPEGARIAENAAAFAGGFRLWEPRATQR